MKNALMTVVVLGILVSSSAYAKMTATPIYVPVPTGKITGPTGPASINPGFKPITMPPVRLP